MPTSTLLERKPLTGRLLAVLVLQLTGHFYWAFAILTAVALAGTTSWVFLVGRVEQVVWHKKLPATTVPA
ncbi:MAG: hypothetical protein LAO03_00855 [Acidobacteriia bacterium]|nr:hypothetical protein [Terriglobia bacterium]